MYTLYSLQLNLHCSYVCTACSMLLLNSQFPIRSHYSTFVLMWNIHIHIFRLHVEEKMVWLWLVLSTAILYGIHNSPRIVQFVYRLCMCVRYTSVYVRYRTIIVYTVLWSIEWFTWFEKSFRFYVIDKNNKCPNIIHSYIFQPLNTIPVDSTC